MQCSKTIIQYETKREIWDVVAIMEGNIRPAYEPYRSLSYDSPQNWFSSSSIVPVILWNGAPRPHKRRPYHATLISVLIHGLVASKGEALCRQNGDSLSDHSDGGNVLRECGAHIAVEQSGMNMCRACHKASATVTGTGVDAEFPLGLLGMRTASWPQMMPDRQCLCVLGMVWRFGYGHSWRLYPISMVGKMGQCWWGSVLGATMTGPVLSDVGLSV
ncbi:hypothetical protein ARMGADRAFT_1062812 [Armillaria gallica]|uniref:Uncharacterized protein n=1 Tax=Armillaria gallica TaxID=47427 RepID=A0A2H3DRF8_ARMGA|nr:hypothetical protein ARMGADRAFT_1062812 [Armillaria gallica]